VNYRIHKNLYKDSVSLMAVTAKIGDVEGIEGASIVMGTPTNIENLVEAGLGSDFEAGPNDLIVAVKGSEEACEAALAIADGMLSENASEASGEVEEKPPTSIAGALARDGDINLALISVPGDYAAAEALKALRLGMDVMIFSDNVTVADELRIKQYAYDRGRIVMGPDCGTAIINGIPLAFANVVRRGPIGVVGASGTGMQEVTTVIDQLGGGISQALGTGGHDLSEDIGGLSLLTGMRALAADSSTTVIVLVSKPPSRAVAEKVLAEARTIAKPVVAIFLGADPADFSGGNIVGAYSLAGAAELAVAIAKGKPIEAVPVSVSGSDSRRLRKLARHLAPSQRDIRALYAGGTFCYETQLICSDRGIVSHSNSPTKGNLPVANIRVSEGHTIVDMGDDAFTQGRPHPMIDPSLRNQRILAEGTDPATAVLLVDVVLGYGSADDPVSGLVAALGRVKSETKGKGHAPVIIAYVCGTDGDPQGREKAISALTSAGALVASSNAEAAAWAAEVVLAAQEASA
jgi:FdrA protein